MKKFEKLMLLASVCIFAFAMVSLADATFSDNWVQAADGTWKVKDAQNNDVTDAWVCDDAVAANGKNIWYLLDKDGNMVSAGLVQDGTGNFYSLETNHNGYFGMLRYEPGTYDGIYLDLEKDHNGSFAAIKNQDGIEKLKEKYGLTVVDIDNFNIVYTADIIRTALGGNGWVKYDSGESYFYRNGKPATGWQYIDGKYYYFDTETGIMATSCYTPDGYYVNSNGVWNGKDAKSVEDQNKTTTGTEEEEVNTKDIDIFAEKEEEEIPAIWDVTAKDNIVNYATKAVSLFAEADALIAEAQKQTDRKTARKKYFNAFGKAAGALEQMYYMKDIIEERPVLKLTDGTVALDAIKAAVKNIESFDSFEIDDSLDLNSASFKNKLSKITDAENIVKKILTTAQSMNATPITR